MPLDSRRLLEESVPIAGLLFVWYVLSALVAPLAEWVIPNTLPVGFRIVGIATAAVFVVVRGIAIARENGPVRLSGDLRELLRESTVVAVPVLAWITLAFVVGVVETLLVGLFGFSTDIATTLDAVFPTLIAVPTQTALATAGLYVVVRIVPSLRTGLKSGGTVAPGDD